MTNLSSPVKALTIIETITVVKKPKAVTYRYEIEYNSAIGGL